MPWLCLGTFQVYQVQDRQQFVPDNDLGINLPLRLATHAAPMSYPVFSCRAKCARRRKVVFVKLAAFAAAVPSSVSMMTLGTVGSVL
jgi:hypothetical protein